MAKGLTWMTLWKAGLSWTSLNLRTRASEDVPCIFFSGKPVAPATVWAALRSSETLVVRLHTRSTVQS